ncbi:hypothetical protein F0562_009415 [Nyssa sinensis]|uniref:EF-hand domain-containing protein n=1 Tax=Nyssa sinensis TaxID=561372 RepID=A0A5J4ZZW0_9ASTE|nr:hypothetical protein F0562_009415 [Nyssa sinensis]
MNYIPTMAMSCPISAIRLIHTGLLHFPTKKFMAWFQSFSVRTPPYVSTNSTTIAQKMVKRSVLHKKAELRSVFATFDKNNDGFITKKELRESVKNIGILMTEKEVSEMVEKVDCNGDGLIDLDEFCELFESMVNREEDGGEEGEGEGEGELKEAFDVFDGDKDGLITVEELRLVLSSLGLKEGKRMENCREMIKKADMDGDGMVNFDEFKKMMKHGGRLVLSL